MGREEEINMKILFVGDIVGDIGRKMLEETLPGLKRKYRPQVTIVNGENAAGGRGITEKIYKEFLQEGVDLVTMGNHTWDNRDIYELLMMRTQKLFDLKTFLMAPQELVIK